MNATLVRAVIRQIGDRESLRDVMNHGADVGFHGFTYHTDTCAFFRRQRANIVALAEEQAEAMGEGVLQMIAGFRCLQGDFSLDDVGRVLYGPWRDSDAHTAIGNAMAWYAAEEVARYLYDK